MKNWDEAGAGTIIKTVIAFPAKILSAQNRFQSLFRGGSGAKVKVLHQVLRHVGGQEGGQRGAEADILAARMQQRQRYAHRLLRVPGQHQGQYGGIRRGLLPRIG